MEHLIVPLLSIITTLVTIQAGAIGVLYLQNRKQSDDLAQIRIAEGVCQEKLDRVLQENMEVKRALKVQNDLQSKNHQENRSILSEIKSKVVDGGEADETPRTGGFRPDGM